MPCVCTWCMVGRECTWCVTGRVYVEGENSAYAKNGGERRARGRPAFAAWCRFSDLIPASLFRTVAALCCSWLEDRRRFWLALVNRRPFCECGGGDGPRLAPTPTPAAPSSSTAAIIVVSPSNVLATDPAVSPAWRQRRKPAVVRPVPAAAVDPKPPLPPSWLERKRHILLRRCWWCWAVEAATAEEFPVL
jgi:hypothetical protein